jgi:hypothetical protein
MKHDLAASEVTVQPKQHTTTESADVFRARVDQTINMKQSWCSSQPKIVWARIDGEIARRTSVVVPDGQSRSTLSLYGALSLPVSGSNRLLNETLICFTLQGPAQRETRDKAGSEGLYPGQKIAHRLFIRLQC